MVRASVFAAVTALLVLSSGAAQAQRESEERALQMQLADRDEYRTKLLLELQRREALLTRQQRTLATQEDRLSAIYAKLSQPVSDEEEDQGAALRQLARSNGIELGTGRPRTLMGWDEVRAMATVPAGYAPCLGAFSMPKPYPGPPVPVPVGSPHWST